MHSTPRAVRGGVANGATPPGAGSRGSLELRKSRRGSAEHAPAHSDVGSSGAIGAAASATGPGPAANGMLADAASSAHARSAADAAQAAGKQQQQEEEEDDDDEPAWQALSQPASPISSDYKPLISATLPAASLREAYDKLLSNDCTFYEDFLERCGHRRITVGEWKRHEQLGSVRDVQVWCSSSWRFGDPGGAGRDQQRFVPLSASQRTGFRSRLGHSWRKRSCRPHPPLIPVSLPPFCPSPCVFYPAVPSHRSPCSSSLPSRALAPGALATRSATRAIGWPSTQAAATWYSRACRP